jgi:U32 family peptidase
VNVHFKAAEAAEYRPEVLAPAGSRECLDAALKAGADAVYFGVQGFNARARAKNFEREDLHETFREIHGYGARGYVTLNTLVFDHELPALLDTARVCRDAGADAVIVQDLGVLAELAKHVPDLIVHASTQTTCTDAASCNYVAELGAKRVILARELSLTDIRQIIAGARVPIEVFVHGALCVAYSGQCMTSEAIGGRSANRGACAQACRLPYDVLVDGQLYEPAANKAYVLSPQDLDASDWVRALVEAGVQSLKIEGRLKSPDYVSATTRHYRALVDAALAALAVRSVPTQRALAREEMLQTYSRGSGPGFFAGVNHQTLVDGKTCDHRGVTAGTFVRIASERNRDWLVLSPTLPLERGDGILVEGGRASAGELGGRIWDAATHDSELWLWLGPDVSLRSLAARTLDPNAMPRIFRTDAPQVTAKIRKEPTYRVPLTIVARGRAGTPLTLIGTSARGHHAQIQTDDVLQAAQNRALDEDGLRDKIGLLADSPFSLHALVWDVAPNLFLNVSQIKDARRRLLAALVESTTVSPAPPPGSHRADTYEAPSTAMFAQTPRLPLPTDAAPQIRVLCRNLAQARAAAESGADAIIVDFLELVGTGECVRMLRRDFPDTHVIVAPPRIRKPGEEKIDTFLTGLSADGFLVRGLGALGESDESSESGESSGSRETTNERRLAAPRYGDFSLNVANQAAARLVLAQGLASFSPALDLNAEQLLKMLEAPDLAARAEVIAHQPLPLFHMEHCVYAALMSTGTDHKTCGRPCEKHELSLRDRAQMSHPVIADVGCRNTVFHERAQSASHLLPKLLSLGVRQFRIELVRESAEVTSKLVALYKRLSHSQPVTREELHGLRAETGYGVVRGSLRVLE